MKRQDISLPDWKWKCAIFYDADIHDMTAILHSLREIGCGRAHLFRAKNVLLADKPNIGLTFSSFENRSSVMVIGRVTSESEFQNTLDHEKGHLARHISLACDIDPYGEEAQYLAGEIGQRMFPVAKQYICGC